MITVTNKAHDAKSPTAYASEEVYTLIEDAIVYYTAGCEVRLVGETPETIGHHTLEGWVTVMPANESIAEWVGVKKDNLSPRPE
jgi:hypothetical protein